MAVLRYVSHPEVAIDPDVPVPDWELSALGHSRARQMVRQPWVGSIGRVVSSPETKAVRTAHVLADHLGLSVEIRRSTGEIDRSATGYVPGDRHEELADRLFGHPTESADGWEAAVDAQSRIVAAVTDVLADGPVDVAVVGHGGVGTLLLCHVAGLEIDRTYDQTRAGCYWTFDRGSGELLHRWLPIDRVV